VTALILIVIAAVAVLGWWADRYERDLTSILALQGEIAQAIDKGWSDWDWQGAETAFQRTLGLNPNHAEARALYSLFRGILKRREEGIPHMERALELDPFHTVIQSWHSFDLVAHGRYDDAIEVARKAVETAPNHLLASAHLIVSLHAKGMGKEAVDAYKTWATARLSRSWGRVTPKEAQRRQ
jgi:tetratricopeptide (TPR) repeat protein